MTARTSQSAVLCVGGWTAWSIDKCSNRDVSRSEREVPTPIESELAKGKRKKKVGKSVEKRVE